MGPLWDPVDSKRPFSFSPSPGATVSSGNGFLSDRVNNTSAAQALPRQPPQSTDLPNPKVTFGMKSAAQSTSTTRQQNSLFGSSQSVANGPELTNRQPVQHAQNTTVPQNDVNRHQLPTKIADPIPQTVKSQPGTSVQQGQNTQAQHPSTTQNGNAFNDRPNVNNVQNFNNEKTSGLAQIINDIPKPQPQPHQQAQNGKPSQQQNPPPQNTQSPVNVDSITAQTQNLSVDAKNRKPEAQATKSAEKSTESVAPAASQSSNAAQNPKAAKPTSSIFSETSTLFKNPGKTSNLFAAPTEKESSKSNTKETKENGHPAQNLSNSLVTFSPPKIRLYRDILSWNLVGESISLKEIILEDHSTETTLEEARKHFPWIGRFHAPDTKLHSFLPYMAMAYNENGCWDKNQALILSSSEALIEQVKWEIRVALFFRRPEKNLRMRLFESLSAAPYSEAQSVIALHTAHLVGEVVLAPAVGSDLAGLKSHNILLPFVEWTQSMLEFMIQAVKDAESRVSDTEARLRLSHTAKQAVWQSLNADEQVLLTDLAKARVLIYQLENLVPYVSSHTGLIHVKPPQWRLTVEESMAFPELLEYVPLSVTLNTSPLYHKDAYTPQCEILRLFLSSVPLTLDAKENAGTFVLNSIAQPDNFVPFELFYSIEQKSQVSSLMRSITWRTSNFYFVSAPVATNESETYFAIEGIVEPYGLNLPQPFAADPITLSVSEIADVFPHTYNYTAATARSKHRSKASKNKSAKDQVDSKAGTIDPPECKTQ